jgi:hypothetical protein
MKKKILAGLLLAGSTMFAAPRVSFGVGFGDRGPENVAPVYAVPPCPGQGYVFVDGYWRLAGGERGWRDNDDYRRDNDRRDFDRGDNDRRAPEHFEHSDRPTEYFRR